MVDRVSIQRPDLAGRLVLGGPNLSHPSYVSLHTSPGDKIPVSLIGSECFPVPLGWGLQTRAFPSSCFLDARLRLPRLDAGHPEAPVTAVKLCFWPAGSGFVMLIYLHHSHSDGACMAEFLQLLGTASRELASPVCMPPPQPSTTPTTGPPNPSSPPPRPSPAKSAIVSETPSSPPPPPSPTRTSSAAPHTTRALSSPSQRPSPPPTTLSTSSSCSRAPRCLQRRRTCCRWRWRWIRGRRGISR